MATSPEGFVTSAMNAVFGKPIPAPIPAPTPVAAPSPAPTPVPDTPMSGYADLWKTKAPDPNAPKPPVPFLDQVTPEAITKAQATIPFGSVVTEEQMAAIVKGGPDAAKAMISAMERMSQEAYGKGTAASTELMKRAIAEARTNWESELPTKIRDAQVRGSAAAKNPALANPALKPITQALETQFAKQFPAATPTEVASMVADYWYQVTQTLVPVDSNPKPTDRGDNINWDEFANS